VGISGSIAAVELPRIIREIIRHGADVQAVMSAEATRLVTEESIEFATGHPPILQLSGAVEHVSLLGEGEGQADLLLIAPATANTISKIAHGIDDTPVTSFASVALGAGVPLLLAPAMHVHMGENPAIRENLDQLRAWGVQVIQPQQAEGEEKLAAPEEIAAAVLHRLARPPWVGRRVLVIGGASRESVDEVRSLTNESSGATGIALATQAYFRGAETQIWLGAVSVPIPSFLRPERWRGIMDLRALLRHQIKQLARFDAIFVPAAISDFTVDRRSGKISSDVHPELTLRLRRAPKVLSELRKLAGKKPRIVGFKLEAGLSSKELARAAEMLLRDNHLDYVAANDQSAMGGQETNLQVIRRTGRSHFLRGSKEEVAGKLLDDIGRELITRASEVPSSEHA
jgi:phosphopantothenoylcysteine decarboxylase/phosphopantothenate--cysteine ligase